MKILLKTLLSVLLIVISNSTANCDNYVLPVPDGGTEAPSPPSITGILKRVTKSELHILPNGTDQLKIIKFTAATQMFTEAGGIVSPGRLVTEYPISIWYTRDTIKKDIYPPFAAVVSVPIRK